MAEATLKNQDTELLGRIMSVNLDGILGKLCHPVYGSGWDRDFAEQTALRYRRFLYLVELYPEEAIVPTKSIDCIWHAHILDTRTYALDCQRLFGHFLHHNPYFGFAADFGLALNKAYERTTHLYNQHFDDSYCENESASLCSKTLCSRS